MWSEGNTLKNGEPTVYNAPARCSVLVNDFLANNNVITLEHPPYPSYLVPVHFCDATDIKKAMNS